MSKPFPFYATVLAVLLSSAVPYAASEEEVPPVEKRDPVSVLNEFIEIGFERNPKLRAAKEQWKASIDGIPEASALPDPMLMYTYMPEMIETRLGPQNYSLKLTQGLPILKIGLRGKVASAEAEKMLIAFRKETQEVVAELKKSVFELAYLDRAVHVVEVNRELLDRLAALAESEYGDDQLKLFDTIRAQSQLSQLEYDRVLMEELRRTEAARINSILHKSPDAEIPPVGELPLIPLTLQVEELIALAEENRAEIQLAKAEVGKKEVERDLAKRSWLPDFQLEMTYINVQESPVRLPNSGDDAFMVGVGVTLPIWFGKNNSAVNKANGKLRQAEQEVESQIDQTRYNIKRIYFLAKNAERLANLYQDTLVPQAERSLDVSETLYREGGQGFTDLLESQSTWYNFQLAKSRAVADYHKNLADLERWTGVNLSGEEVSP
jgi:outer membrane protein TolC